MKRHWTLFVTADLDLGTGQRNPARYRSHHTSSNWSACHIFSFANPKKNKNKKKKKNSMALGLSGRGQHGATKPGHGATKPGHGAAPC